METPTYHRAAALRTGGLIGLGFALLSSIPNLILDARSIVALSVVITAVSCVLTLAVGIAMGLFGARAAGAGGETRVRAGLLAGLAGGVVMGIISMVVSLYLISSGFMQQVTDLSMAQQLAAAPPEQRAVMQQALNQSRGMSQMIQQISAFGAPVISGVINMALGALGGLLYKPKPAI